MVDFLKTAWYSWRYGSETSSDMTTDLFWGISGISSPDRMFDNAVTEVYTGLDTLDRDEFDCIRDSPSSNTPSPPQSPHESQEADESENYYDTDGLDQHRLITLYQSSFESEVQGEPLGLVFDQKHHKVVFIATKADIPDALDLLRNWHYLEEILDLWHGMIDYGKVKAVNGRWIMQSLASNDLENTLQSWHELVDDIESRMPADADFPRDISETMLDGFNARSLNLSPFRCQFLTSARRPKFRFIAPGIIVPQSRSLWIKLKQV